MDSSRDLPVRPRPWFSLWFTALGSLIAQLALCQFFTFGRRVPISIDVDPSNLWKYAYHFPPRGEFLVLNWLGIANLPPTLNPFSLAAAHFSTWFFFTTYAPLVSTMALLAMAAFLRELELSRPAALFGGVIYAWQGDLLPFVFPGHYGYITTWPFFAVAAWGALRAQRTRQQAYALIGDTAAHSQPTRESLVGPLIALFRDKRKRVWSLDKLGMTILNLCKSIANRLIASFREWKERVWPLDKFRMTIMNLWVALRNRPMRHSAYSVMSGASCGMMVGLQPDRGAMASLLVAALYLAPIFSGRAPWMVNVRQLVLCAGLALLISLAAFLALFQSYIVGVKMGSSDNREETFNMATQYSLGPAETLTYPAPGVFGWTSSSVDGPYWGWIGQTPGWQTTHQGTRNLNLAISTTGTVATVLALLGVCLLLPGAPGRLFGNVGLSERQIYFGRLFLILGGLALLLAWGYHTPLYRPLFGLPLMDKWRDPLKWLEITDFALIVLSALGVQALLRSLAPDTRALRRRLKIFFGVATALFAVGFLAGYLLSIWMEANLSQSGYEPPSIANALHTLHVALGFALALAGGAWLMLAGAWRAERLRRWKIVNPWLSRLWNEMLLPEHLPATLAVALALLGAVQLRWVASEFIQPVDLAQITATNPLLEALKAEGPKVRVAVPAPQDMFLNVYLQNQFIADRISSVDISAASRIPDDLAAFLGALGKHPVRLWFLAGVKNVAVAQQAVAQMHQDPEVAAAMEKADGYTLPEAGTGDEPSHALVGLRDYLAKATFVPRAEIISDDGDLLKRLVDSKWNPRESVLLSAPEPGGAGATPLKNSPAQVTLSTYTPHEIDLTVDAPSAGYVLINDQYDPDWEVEANGKTGKLLRADYLLRAIAVDAGASRIVLRYVAHYRVAGFNIPVVAMNLFSDGVMIAAWLIAGLALWWWRGRQWKATDF